MAVYPDKGNSYIWINGFIMKQDPEFGFVVKIVGTYVQWIVEFHVQFSLQS